MIADSHDAPGAIYRGRVMHRRLAPLGHRFDYRVFSLFVDVDAIPAIARRCRLLGHNRFNLFSLHDRDHGPRDGSPLRPWLEDVFSRAGYDGPTLGYRLLTFPRILGYVFNPLSIYFAYRPDGGLAGILYEVRNTFGDMHSYLIPVAADRPPGTPIVQRCDKAFYVSPFMEMDAEYHFRLKEPAERLSILIRQYVDGRETLVACQTGERLALDDRSLARLFVSHPLMTLKVVAAIHWQAWRLWRKGARFRKRTAPPAAPVTFFPLTRAPR
ncbi:MAG: DUF1365 domain-containing protein [Azospirillaceae bacterium]